MCPDQVALPNLKKENELSNQLSIFSTYLICGHLPAQVGAIASHHNLGVPQRVILQHSYPGSRVNIHLLRNVRFIRYLVRLVHLSSRTVPSLGQSGGSLSQSIHLNFCLLPPPTPSITLNVSVSLLHGAFVFRNCQSN